MTGNWSTAAKFATSVNLTDKIDELNDSLSKYIASNVSAIYTHGDTDWCNITATRFQNLTSNITSLPLPRESIVEAVRTLSVPMVFAMAIIVFAWIIYNTRERENDSTFKRYCEEEEEKEGYYE